MLHIAISDIEIVVGRRRSLRRIQRFHSGLRHRRLIFDLLRPGALYMGKYFQISAAADLPLRGAGRRQGGGLVMLLDLSLDEIHPAFGWTPFGKHHHHNEDKDHDLIIDTGAPLVCQLIENVRWPPRPLCYRLSLPA